MGDPVIAIAPFLLALGAWLLIRFGWRVTRLTIGLIRRARWRSVQAVVTDVSLREGRDASSRGDGVVRPAAWATPDAWFVTYSYDIGGEPYTGRARWHTLPPPADGITLTVHVDPERPGHSEFLDFSHPAWTLVGYVVAAAIGALLVGRSVLAFTHIGD
ncbi:DUF3592 domain-containing protein [Luteipulveratus mongoliensis]|uniref:DUF3592 domain-containing protein n=1 Tax=Luteipulveratus mongoliensis TaxID=571913 RepID=A0A0K1JFS3_9MICO|nr:DUF3592 domain-containing protein [Luteipulveratus mongoliensis]AKU15551.1 hypothetical protein VV02_06240 [Luteipulveratus mongoliensis]